MIDAEGARASAQRISASSTAGPHASAPRTSAPSTPGPHTAAPRTSAPSTSDTSASTSRLRALPLGVRTSVALALTSVVGVAAFTWPLLVGQGSVLAQNAAAPVVLAGVLLGVVLISLIALGDGGIDAKTVTMLGLLAAIGAVLRPLSAGSAGIELVFLFIILGGRVFGPGFGFALGSITLFASALLTGGFGPWLPFQMLAASWIGMGAGLLPRRLHGGRELVVLALFAAVCGFLYGQLMNLSFWPFTLGPGTGLSFVAGAPLWENLQHFALFSLTTSLGWDLMRAVVLALGVALLGRPVLSALRRTARIGSFSAPNREPEKPRPSQQRLSNVSVTSPTNGAESATH